MIPISCRPPPGRPPTRSGAHPKPPGAVPGRSEHVQEPQSADPSHPERVPEPQATVPSHPDPVPKPPEAVPSRSEHVQEAPASDPIHPEDVPEPLGAVPSRPDRVQEPRARVPSYPERLLSYKTTTKFIQLGDSFRRRQPSYSPSPGPVRTGDGFFDNRRKRALPGVATPGGQRGGSYGPRPAALGEAARATMSR